MLLWVVYAVRGFGIAARWLVLLATTLWLKGLAPEFTGVIPDAPTIVCFLIALCLWIVLYRVRQFFFLTFCGCMIRSGITPVLRFAVWELIYAGSRTLPGDVPKYAGYEVLLNTYETLNAVERGKMVKAIRDAQQTTPPGLS